ncbi:PREDICTED: solute carrier organic anion transporter family member 3A1-like [Branchiostoma belcheri]|uniref:Solute carrier organic anion transporter family member n=1 Tax=Branchiostoma belcheri TaxID=7741 RepID=A0A6P4ZJL1_BRABE|nr:PREDICTED: solute carrier organic anion transporter family member 3A1-like [Branchiostoma belcheri]
MSKNAHAQEEDVSCGVGACKPRWAARLANPKLFVLSWCFVIMTSLAGGAYVAGVLTTLEKRFGLQSQQLGLFSSAADVGSMLTVLFVTYYGGKPGVSRPKIIAVGTLLLAFAAALSGLPHFIAPAYDTNLPGTENNTKQDTCMANQTVSSCGKEEEEAASSQGQGLLLLLLAQVIYGVGSTPVRPLGTTYIDDQVPRASAPIYIGVSSVVFVIGIPLGFIMSAFAIQFYIDIDKGIDPAEFGMTPDNPMWVGAWWLGFFICAAALVVVAIPMFFFPTAMKKPADSDDHQEEKEEKSAKRRMLPMIDDTDRREPLLDSNRGLCEQLKDMAKSLKDILTNATFMMLCLSGVCNTSISGAHSFMPKYMEVQFGIPKSQANMLVAPVVLPFMIIGFLASGFIIKRFKLTPRQCVYMSIVCTVVSTLGFIGMFFFTCPVPPMAGVTIPYGYSPYMPNSPQLSAADFNLLSPCNTNCSCGTEKYSPVCGSDGVTYFSGCHAGCTVKQSFMNPMGFTLANYSNCACLAKLPPAVLAEKFGLGGKQHGSKPSSDGQIPPAAGGMEEENVRQRERRNKTTPGIPGDQDFGIRIPESEGQIPGNSTGIPDSGDQIPGNGTGVPGMRMPSFAIGAPCSQTCSQWKYFLASFVGVAFVGSFGMIPTIISVLRSLTPETKSFGMGVQVVFYRLIGFIPSPIYFGALIDSTCRLWSTTCGKRGSCLLYDLDRNRYYFLGLMVILRMCSILFELVAAHLFKKREESKPEGKEGGATNRDIAASLGSLAGSIRSLDTTGRDENPKDTEELRMNIWNKGEEAEEAKPLA